MAGAVPGCSLLAPARRQPADGSAATARAWRTEATRFARMAALLQAGLANRLSPICVRACLVQVVSITGMPSAHAKRCS